LVGQATDPAVAQAVVDERENVAGDRRVGLVLATALGDRLEAVPEGLSAVVARHCLDGGPAHQADPC
jgi:hypothetical protein